MLLAFCINKSFEIGLNTLLYSLFKHNPKLKSIDRIIITNDNLNIDYNFIYIKPDQIFSYVKNLYADYRYTETFNKLQLFQLAETYDKIIYLDSDMLCTGDVSEIITKTNDKCFYACEDIGVTFAKPHGKRQFKRINSGMMVINKLPKNSYNQIIKLTKNKDSYDGGDQGIINSWLDKFNIDFGYLNQKYNCLKRIPFYHPDYYNSELANDVRLWHYVGKKPWQSFGGPKERRNYKNIEEIWRNYHAEYARLQRVLGVV